MRTVQLALTVPVKLDGSGNGSAQVGPTASGESWDAGFTLSVRCATNVAEATCLAFWGGGPQYFIDATTWGSTGDSLADTPSLVSGQAVYAQWAGGDPGTTAYLTVTGTRQVP